MNLVADVLKFLQGEPPKTFSEIFDALDFEGTRGELRTCLESMALQAKLLKGNCADGFTRYSLTKFEREPIAPAAAKSPASTTSHAQPTDVASAAASTPETSVRAGVEVGHRKANSPIADIVLRLLTSRGREWLTVRDMVFRSGDAVTAQQITSALQNLRKSGLAEVTGKCAGARWRATQSPRPQGTTEPEAVAAAAEVVAASEPSSSATPPALPRTLSPLPARLLARIESIAVDIEDLTGEAIDAGLGASALKSLIAAGGAIRRALLPYNLRN
jgi:hypothetical protein